MSMYTRRLPLPDRSFFLFGPRGTGKTTWLRQQLPDARWFNLLLDRELLRLVRDPGVFRQEIDALPNGAWVVVDEVQKLPALLDDVHDVLTATPRRLRFALTGSSARRLRRGDANLLAGRVVSRTFHPLTAAELGEVPAVDDVLRFGMLPLVRSESRASARIDLLDAYVSTYLAQEIRAEALVRSLDSFARFLEIAALANGQVTNLAGIARDAAVARPSVQGYFDVLVDTLIAVWLPAWRPRAKVKEVAHPKLYFFDPGVARALTGRLHDPIDSSERGPLLETYVLHELRAYINETNCGGTLSYWRTPSGSEVDFVWRRGKRAIGIEVKTSGRWRSEDGVALRELVAGRTLERGIGVYAGAHRLRDGAIDVLPVADFVRDLARGKIIG
jgi:uncharacterized protein